MKTQFRRNSVAKYSRNMDLGSGAKTQLAAGNAPFHPNSGAPSCSLMGDGYAGPCAASQPAEVTCVNYELAELLTLAEVPGETRSSGARSSG